jgi:hypothetical protein
LEGVLKGMGKGGNGGYGMGYRRKGYGIMEGGDFL